MNNLDHVRSDGWVVLRTIILTTRFSYGDPDEWPTLCRAPNDRANSEVQLRWPNWMTRIVWDQYVVLWTVVPNLRSTAEVVLGRGIWMIRTDLKTKVELVEEWWSRSFGDQKVFQSYGYFRKVGILLLPLLSSIYRVMVLSVKFFH